jgi:hypothetical protein
LSLGKALVLDIDHDHELAAAGHQLLETDQEIVPSLRARPILVGPSSDVPAS